MAASIERSGKSRSQHSHRAHSVARFDSNCNESKRFSEINARNYTMTLPSSYGRHRSKQNGFYIKSNSINKYFIQYNFEFFFFAEIRSQSVDPRIYNSKYDAPVLCNQYAIDKLMRKEIETEQRQSRSRSMPRSQNRNKNLYTPSREPSPDYQKQPKQNDRAQYLAPPTVEYHNSKEYIELEVPAKKFKRRKSSQLPPSPR